MALVGPWPASKLDDVLSEFLRFPDVAKPERDRVLERGALLHADIAILAHRPDGTYDLPDDGRSIVVIRDGEEIRRVGGTFQWAFARRLLDAVTRTAATDDYARAWYRATAAMLQFWEDHAELRPHLDRGLERFPDDPNLLVIDGAMHARFAGPRFQAVSIAAAEAAAMPMAANSKVFAPAPAPTFDIQSAGNERRAAETSFRAALKLDPTLDEARVRLGDLLGADGRHADALDQMDAALARPLPAALHYDAWLIAGREDEAAGRTADARTAYQRAMTLYPHARTARLAFSRVLREAGDRDGALHALDELADPNVNTDDDPWWLYDDTHTPAARDLVAGLERFLESK